jgi:hypothetical protein
MIVIYNERRLTVRKPSLAEAVLTAIETLTEDLRWLYESDAMQATETFQGAIRRMANLEELARRRVDDATYQAHRRSMETCHISLPKQATGA